MKKISALILALAVMLACLCSCSGTTGSTQTATDDKDKEIMESTPDKAPTMSIPDTEVAAGDVFSVFVNLDNPGWNWDSFEFVVLYDSSIVKITEVKTTELTSGMLNMTKLDYDENKIKLAFATAEELEGGGDIAEIVCSATGSGSFKMELTEIFMSRGVTYKATNTQDVVEIKNVDSKSGTITVKDETETEATPLLSVESAEVDEGAEFTLAVTLENAEQWDSFELLIKYDDSIMEIESAETTEITKNMLNLTQNDKGKLKLAFATAEELTENGKIVILKCKALKKGTCELKLTKQLMSRELEGKVVEIEGVRTENGTVTVK